MLFLETRLVPKQFTKLDEESVAVDFTAPWTHSVTFTQWYRDGLRPQDLDPREYLIPVYAAWLKEADLIDMIGELVVNS